MSSPLRWTQQPWRLALIGLLAQAALLWLVNTVDALQRLGGLAAATVYLPLLLFQAMGLTVTRASGGWASPTVLGWTLVAAFWALAWLGVGKAVAALTRPSGAPR